MPSAPSPDFDSLDQRIDALCTRLGSDHASGATDFANRNGKNDASRAWFATIWIATDGSCEGEDGREEDAIADSLAVMLEHGRDLTPKELSELVSHGPAAVAIAMWLIAL